jgi:hypothetical protein
MDTRAKKSTTRRDVAREARASRLVTTRDRSQKKLHPGCRSAAASIVAAVKLASRADGDQGRPRVPDGTEARQQLLVSVYGYQDPDSAFTVALPTPELPPTLRISGEAHHVDRDSA